MSPRSPVIDAVFGSLHIGYFASKHCLGLIAAIACCACTAHAADWRQFRGTDTTLVADDAPLPTSWSETENITWSVALPGRGLSSPIIVGENVVVTCSSGYHQDRLHVLCFAVADGSLRWERQFWATGRTISHPKTCVASSTPASDGERIFAQYSSNDLACLDLMGNLLWYRGLTVDFPNASNSLGMASSPIVAGNTLVVQVENDSQQSLAVGINPEDGTSRWTQQRPQRANWTSPTVMRGDQAGDDVVLLQSSAGIAAIDPFTGSSLWNYTNGASTIPTSAVKGRTLYAVSHGITALHFPEGSANYEQLWRAERLNPSTASPIAYGDDVFIINGAGVLVCAAQKDGTVKWQLRLEGPFTSSPVAAKGHLYVFNEAGVGQVVNVTGEKGEVAGKGDLKDVILATPSIAHGALYVRSDKRLWKISVR